MMRLLLARQFATTCVPPFRKGRERETNANINCHFIQFTGDDPVERDGVVGVGGRVEINAGD